MDTQADYDKIVSFFNGFSALDNNVSHLSVGEEIVQYANLFEGVKPFLKEIEEYEQLFAPHYNIFSILKIKTAEAITHTPVIANLLNPKGSHNQGVLYCNIFFKEILGMDNFIVQEAERERNTTDGFIDVYVQGEKKHKPFVAIIENKVNAKDGEKQLEKYYNYLIKNKGLKEEQFVILYLTLQGNSPTIPFSISKKLYEKLIVNNNLQLISYHKDISNWLKNCISVTQPSSVKEVLAQYLTTIKTLQDERE